MRDSFPELLFKIRRKRKLLQKQVADRAKLDQSYIAGLERGRRDPPKPATIDRICHGLEMTPEEASALHDAAAIGRVYKTLDEIEAVYSRADGMRRLVTAANGLSEQSFEVLDGIVELLSRNDASAYGRQP